MTISSTTNKVNHVPDGVITVFAYAFRVDNEADMTVLVDDVEQATGWTISGLGDPAGGDVTFAIAPTGTTVTLLRDIEATQGVDYSPYDAFPAETHELALDKLTMITQQLAEAIARAALAPISDDGTTDFTLPAYDAGKGIMWDPVAKELTVSTDNFNDIVTNATAQAVAAAASALAASTSATNAATSETNAAASAAAAAADALATAADVLATAADVLLTNADVVSTNADAVSTAADAASTAIDAAATASDKISTENNKNLAFGYASDAATEAASAAADAVLTAADAVSTAADVVSAAASAAAAAASATSAAASAYHDIAATISGAPADSQVLLVFSSVRAFDLPASLTGSTAESLVAAAAATTLDIKKNGTSIGSINFAAAATVGTFTFTTLTSFIAGDVLSVHNQSTADTTLADIGFNFMASLP